MDAHANMHGLTVAILTCAPETLLVILCNSPELLDTFVNYVMALRCLWRTSTLTTSRTWRPIVGYGGGGESDVALDEG